MTNNYENFDPKEQNDTNKNEHQLNTVTLEKIQSQTIDKKNKKVKEIIEKNKFTTIDLKKHKLNRSSIYLAIFAVIIVSALVIALLIVSFIY